MNFKYDDQVDIDTLGDIWKRMKDQIQEEQQRIDKPNLSDLKQYSQVQLNPRNLSIQLQQLQDELQKKNKKLVQSQQRINELEETLQKTNTLVLQLQSENQLLHEKLLCIEEVVDSVQLEKTSSRLIRLENEQMKKDIQRFIQLLKSTENFQDTNIDSQQSYMGINLQNKSRILDQNNNNQKIKLKVKEEIFWIPQRVIEIINDIEMNQDSKQDLLILLNITYLDYYTQKLSKHKSKSRSEITNLKRNINQRIPYQDMINQRKTERTKLQLSDQKLETVRRKSENKQCIQ